MDGFEMLDKFYNGKRVAVTGGAGFVGVQLVTELIAAGADVYVGDNFSRGQNTVAGADYLQLDVTDPGACNYLFRGGAVRGTPVDVVFNLAATVAGVLHNMNHHHEMFMSNMKVQSVPVMAADELGIPVFMQTSSVCVYAPEFNEASLVSDGHKSEPHPANAGYAWAKRVGEKAVQWSNIERGVIVRPSNVFGPYDYFDEKAHVIPALIKKALEDDVINVYGPKHVVREFIYSNDVALGMMHVAAFGKNKMAYNLGCGGASSNVTTITALAESIRHIAGMDHKEIVYHEGVGGGDPIRYSVTDETRALGWDFSVPLADGLDMTVDWYVNG